MRNFLIFAIPIVGALLQSFGVSLFGVIPDLALVFAIAVAFFADSFMKMVFISAITIFVLKFSPGFSFELLFVFIIPILIFSLRERMPWTPFLNALISCIVAIFVFFLIFSFRLIPSLVFLKEITLDLAFFFAAFWVFYENCTVSEHSFRKARKFI